MYRDILILWKGLLLLPCYLEEVWTQRQTSQQTRDKIFIERRPENYRRLLEEMWTLRQQTDYFEKILLNKNKVRNIFPTFIQKELYRVNEFTLIPSNCNHITYSIVFFHAFARFPNLRDFFQLWNVFTPHQVKTVFAANKYYPQLSHVVRVVLFFARSPHNLEFKLSHINWEVNQIFCQHKPLLISWCPIKSSNQLSQQGAELHLIF